MTQNDEKMSRKIGNAQSNPTFFRHSAVLSLPGVLLHKVPNNEGNHLITFCTSLANALPPRIPCKSSPFINSTRILLLTFLKLESAMEGDPANFWGVTGNTCLGDCSS